MYLSHFSLTEFPFGLTPDTHYYFDLPSHRDALNVLLISLKNGEGFIKITGDVGTGKTMLCRKLLNELQDPFITAYIPNPQLTATGLYIAIAEELGISFSNNDEQSKILQKINEYLLNAATKRQKPVLIIDEAQAMPLETLEALRLITNLETEKQKLFQIILFGQPELDELLQKKSIRQLRQRISFSHTLKQLTANDVDAYIKHRLTVAKSTNPSIFSKPANKALHFYSKGIPRLVNILAHKALLSAYGKGLNQVGFKQVQLAARDTEDTKKHRYPFEYRRSILFAFIVSLCIFIIPFLPLNNSNQSIFEMSILNQVLQDLEKRHPKDALEQNQSENTNTAGLNNNKLLYIPIILIGIAGIFVFSKYRFNDEKEIVPETEPPQIVIAPSPLSTTSNKKENNLLEKPQPEELLYKKSKVDSAQETAKIKHAEKQIAPMAEQVNDPEKENKLAEQFFETAKKQQSHVDKKLNLNLAIKLNPEHIEARLLLANTLLHLGLVDEANQLLDQSIKIFPQNQQFINLHRQLSTQSKQLKEAQDILKKIDANYKKDALVTTTLIEQEYFVKDKGEYNELKKPGTKKIIAKSKTKKIKILSKKQQAKKLFDAAQQTKTLPVKQRKLEQAIELNPLYLEARFQLAHTLVNQGLSNKAAEFLDQSLDLFPQNLNFINLRSQLLLHKQQPEDALKLLLQIDADTIQDEFYLSLLSAAYQKNNNYPKSLETYQKLTIINSEKAEYWLGLAIALEKQGKNQEAVDAYQQSLLKNPLKNKIVDYIKERISILKK